jgi:5'-3' exonuclease
VVVYGLDADLIMLALNHVHLVSQIYVFRETAEFHAEDVAALREETYTLLDITVLAAHISYYVGISPKEYILLCFFLGNDFMPHFPAVCLRTTGMDFLLDVYAKLKKPLLREDGEIHWKNLKLFVEMLARAERARMIEEDHARDKMARRVAGFIATAKTEEEKTLHIPILRREIEKYICPHENGWEARYYRALFSHGGATADICARFLEGLEWTYKYYCGFCTNWKWHYPYHYPPLLCDLYKHIPVASGSVCRGTYNAESISPTQQLEFIMPPSTEIARQFVSDENNIVWAYCRYYWEAHLKFTGAATAH